MGTDYAIACRDCLEFIDLHKWSIHEEAGRCLVAAHNLSHDPSRSFMPQRIPSISNQLVVPVTAQQLRDCLGDFVPCQPYIEELLPFVRDFIVSHQDHFLFLSCDTGEHPWDFGEPRCFDWREIQAKFNHNGQFLPKNLIQDFGFRYWEEVLEYYLKHKSWFLSEQMRDDLEALKQAFEQEVSAID
ncbi:MAG: hypothetical protein AAF383_18685 [Cyanobacteria bacterium P01_A01_bin.83]